VKYKQIRYTTPFMSEAAVKKAMEKAKAFNVMGIGKWKIEERDGGFDLLFIPSFGLRIALNRGTHHVAPNGNSNSKGFSGRAQQQNHTWRLLSDNPEQQQARLT